MKPPPSASDEVIAHHAREHHRNNPGCDPDLGPNIYWCEICPEPESGGYICCGTCDMLVFVGVDPDHPCQHILQWMRDQGMTWTEETE